MIAIIKYNAGNIKSVQNALGRLNCESIITDDKELIKSAEKVIFPGVGEANSAMRYLRERGLDKLITELNQAFLGICLGLQLMCKHSEEGNTDCIGIFDSTVKLFPPEDKVPHMGWNSFSALNQSKILSGISPEHDVYYVHSYYAEICPQSVAVCDYIEAFSSVLEKDNFYATQFHPEKSADVGERILKNFLEL